MKNLAIATATALLLSSQMSTAQTVIPATDKAIEGQLKRMVYIQWDDWRPRPTSWSGFFYWNWTWRKYYRGNDKRPYKVGGNFEQDLGAYNWYKNDEADIQDEVTKEAQHDALEFAAKQGGVLDYPYNFYYKDIFDKLNAEIATEAGKLALFNAKAYELFIKDRYYKDYLEEFVPFIKERVETTHEGIAERGDRILSYIAIQRQYEEKNAFIKNLMQMYKKLEPMQPAKVLLPIESAGQTDAQIRARILGTIRL